MTHCRKLFIPFILLALLTALLLQPHAAAQTPAAQMPDEPTAVYISDLADVLSDELEASIVERSAALDALTGAQLMVVTVDFLGGAAIRDYADDLFNRLQIGDSAKNNGLLLLLAVGEENYYALQGRGLEAALPDTTLEVLLQQSLEPDFAAGHYEAGVQKTYGSFLTALEGLYGIGDQGVLAAVAQAKAAQIRLEKAEAQKRLLLIAIGIALLVLLVLLITARRSYARRRRIRKKAAGSSRTDN